MQQYANQAGAGASIGYAQTISAPPQPVGIVEGIDGELNISLKMIHELNGQARTLCDRLFGTQPEAVDAGKGNPSTSSHTGRLEATAGYIRESITELRSHLQRLDRL